MSFSLVQVHGDTYRRQLELLTEANADGVEMTGQVAPRPVGLDARFGVHAAPAARRTVVYREIAALPLAERVEIMSRSGVQGAGACGRRGAARRRQRGWAYPPGVRSDVRARRSARLRARRRRQHRGPGARAKAATRSISRTTCCSRDGGRSFLYLPFLNYADGNLDAVGEMLAHPNTVIGLADGGAHLGTICDASFPTTLLDALGARPRSRSARPSVRGAAPHERDRAHRRPARPRRARARVPRRRERDRLRAPHCPPTGDASRPPGRR